MEAMYILIYPQGCDVSNHLSLFLCVANHDKLLPGWSHFAQFTIAVVNKDPKKSKYSDTLHRFWKKEHDWGWKKFMELAKVSDGFIVADTLVIKAQVQVIREKAHRPFRCLDRLYRRELVRVYLSNVEQICRRFVEERRGKLSKLIEDKMRWTSFRAFWLGIDLSSRRRMSRDKADAILKVVVKHFFIEKEVTSTLVMDSLYSGLKALECQSKSKKGRAELDFEELPAPMVRVDKDMFVLADDVLLLLERAALEPLPHQPSPPKDEKGLQTRPKDGGSGEELNKDSIEHDERRLTELGRRTVEIFVLAHIFSRIEVAYQDAVALKRQEELIREEEEAWQVENELRAKRTIAEKEKRAKKKQAKQKRKSRKGKDKGRDEKSDALMLDKHHPEIPFSGRIMEDYAATQSVIAKTEASEDASELSDAGDDAPEALQPELEDRDTSSISDTSEIHHTVETSGSEKQNGQMEKRNSSVIDDSCLMCSTNSASSAVVNGSYKGNSLPNNKCQTSPIGVKSQQIKDVDHGGSFPSSNATSDADSYGDPQPEQEAIVALKDKIQKPEQHLVEKEERVVSLQKKLNIKDPAEVEQHPKSRSSESSSSLFSPAKKLTSSALQSKRTMERNASTVSIAESVSSKELPSISPSQTEKFVPRPLQASLISISESQKVTTPGMSSANQNLPAMSRPLSAPLAPSPRPASPVISTVQTVPQLLRSLSAVDRTGTTEPSPSAPSYVPQSYRNAIMGKTTVGVKSTAFTHTSTSSGQAAVHSQSPTFVSSMSMFTQSSVRNGPISATPGLTFGSAKTETMHSQRPWGGDYAKQEVTSSGNYDPNIAIDSSSLNIYGNSIGNQTSLVSSNATTGQLQGTVSDEFPHIAIINDLLDEDHSSLRLHMNHHHALNRQCTFPRDVSTSGIGPLSAPCRYDRADQYYGEGFHRMYGPSNGLNELRDGNLAQMDLSGYANGQIDGAVQNQWPYNHSDLSMLSLGSFETNGYSYQLPDNLNPGYGENGYSMYRPSKRH